MSALGGGNTRQPLALTFRRHRTGDSFHEDDPERTHHGGRLIRKKPPVGGGINEIKNDETQSTV
jgi:hypothetical protein